jgi:hypothetical protein
MVVHRYIYMEYETTLSSLTLSLATLMMPMLSVCVQAKLLLLYVVYQISNRFHIEKIHSAD